MGLSYDTLYDLTIWELDTLARAKSKAAQRAIRHDLSLRWHQAAWSRMDIKLPKLDDVLGEPETVAAANTDEPGPEARKKAAQLLGNFRAYQAGEEIEKARRQKG